MIWNNTVCSIEKGVYISITLIMKIKIWPEIRIQLILNFLYFEIILFCFIQMYMIFCTKYRFYLLWKGYFSYWILCYKNPTVYSQITNMCNIIYFLLRLCYFFCYYSTYVCACASRRFTLWYHSWDFGPWYINYHPISNVHNIGHHLRST